MRARIDVIFERGEYSFEVSALNRAGKVLCLSLSTRDIADALSGAIADGIAGSSDDVERAMAVMFLGKLREVVGPVSPSKSS